ncbi:MAG TPA: hypothetical protein VK357_14505, partial [Rubrobacteraceae bacterium]|nr:hypothetical protein [Rubrobacteraceae bacterium]
MRYDVVFLDVDKTILWVDVDIEGYVEDLAPYTKNGSLTVEQAEGAVWEGMRKHIYENINYQTEEELAEFRRNNARDTARNLGLDVPGEVLDQVQERRILYNPYPESEAVMEELAGM